MWTVRMVPVPSVRVHVLGPFALQTSTGHFTEDFYFFRDFGFSNSEGEKVGT